MKHIINNVNTMINRLLAVSFLISFGTFTVYGNSTYYSEAKVYAKGEGKVYVSKTENNSISWDSQGTNSSDSNNEKANNAPTHTYYAYASANTGYEFLCWSETESSSAIPSTVTSKNDSYTITITATENTAATETLYAYFVPVFNFAAATPATVSNGSYTISVATTQVVGTTINQTSGSTTATYTASPDAGYFFDGWFSSKDEFDDDSKKVSAENPYSTTINNSTPGLTVTSPQYYARFAQTKTPTFTVASQSLNVGDTYNGFSFINTSTETPTDDSDDNFYFVVSNQNVTTSNTTGSPDGTKVISFDGSTVTALNAGTAKIKFYQKADAANHILAGESSEITITVTKNTNTILVNGENAYSTSINYASNQAITITSDNGLSDPSVTANNEYLVDGVEYTSTTASTGSITTTYNAGTAKWNVTQAENYKYHAGSATITATVAALSETCYLVNDADEHELNDGDLTYEWSDTPNVVGALSFDAKKKGSTSMGEVSISEKDAEGNWSVLTTKSAGWGSSDPIKTDYNTFTDVTLSSSSKGVKFTQANNDKYIRNVQVTRLLFLTPSVGSIAFGNTLANTPLTETFTLDWSCSQNDGDITLVSDDLHFTLSTDNETFSSSVTIANASQTTGRSGRTTLYVKYVSAETGDHSGHITIYNKSRKSTVDLAGTTQGKYDLVISGANITSGLYVGDAGFASGFSFAFEGSDVAVGTPTEGSSAHFYYVLTNNTVADDATWPDNEYSNKIVEYNAASNTFTAYNAGTATITFYETGNSTINARDPQAYTITVSKVTPEFTQKLSSIAVNHNVALSDFASSTSDGTLSWSLPSNSYASTVNNKIVTVGEGSVTVTVSQASTYKYAAAETTMDLEITAVSGTDWLEKPAPAAGSYYLLNVGANQFIKMNNGYPATTETIADATLFTITGTSATDIAYTKSETTYYIKQSAGTYSESSDAMPDGHKWNINVYNTNYYQIYSNNKDGSNDNNGNRFITANGGNANCSCSKNSSEYNTANGSWIFVTEGEYAAFRAYLAAQAILTDDNHLSESLKGDLATAVASKTKGTDDYATWTSTLTTLTANCSTYVANLEAAVDLRQDASGNGYYMFYNATYNTRLGDDVQAYTAAWSGSSLTLTAVPDQVIPAGDVALVYSNTKSEFYYAFETAAASAIANNAFVHHDASYQSGGVNGDHTDYILTAQKEGETVTSYAFCKYVGDNHDELFEDNDKNVLVWTNDNGAPAPSVIRIVTEENIATALVPVYGEDATQASDNANGKKLLIDGKLYIQQGNNLYDALGRKVQ